jgi:hypothetical protein
LIEDNMTPASLKIGQLIFYLMRAEGRIEPLRVVEELSRKTLKGTETIYMVQIPDSPTPVALNTLEGEVFLSVEDVQRIFTERSNAAIKKLIESALKKARERFPDAQLVSPEQLPEEALADLEEGDVMEVDGQLVRVRSVDLPDALK